MGSWLEKFAGINENSGKGRIYRRAFIWYAQVEVIFVIAPLIYVNCNTSSYSVSSLMWPCFLYFFTSLFFLDVDGEAGILGHINLINYVL